MSFILIIVGHVTIILRKPFIMRSMISNAANLIEKMTPKVLCS